MTDQSRWISRTNRSAIPMTALFSSSALILPIKFNNLPSKVKFEYLTAEHAAPKFAVLSTIVLGAQALSVCLNTEMYQPVRYNTLTVGGQLFSICMIPYYYLSVLGV